MFVNKLIAWKTYITKQFMGKKGKLERNRKYFDLNCNEKITYQNSRMQLKPYLVKNYVFKNSNEKKKC